MEAPIDKLLNVPDVVYIILSYLTETRDILSICLTSKYFSEAGRPHLFRNINLPEISVKASRKNKPAFHQRFSDELSKYTRQLEINGCRVSSETIFSIEPIHRQYMYQDESHRELKTKMDRLFDGLELTLQRVPRLRAICAHLLPRSLDLLIMVQRHCPNIECVAIEPLMSDFVAYRNQSGSTDKWMSDTYTLVDIGSLAPSVSVLWSGSLFPLANGVNMKIPPSVPLTFDFPRLTYLSLDGVSMVTEKGFFVDSIVSLLAGSPNLQVLGLAGFTTTTAADVYEPNPHAPVHTFVQTPFHEAYPPGSFAELPDSKVFPDFLQSLCGVYRRSGANPLRLRYLRLGQGTQPTNRRVLTPQQDHYLACLTDLSCLEELHFDFHDETSDHSPMPHMNMLGMGDAQTRFLWPDTIRLITDGHLPRLRKLTIPWAQGLSWCMLATLDPKIAANLVVDVHCDQKAADPSLFPIRDHPLGDLRGLLLNLPPFSVPQPAIDPTQPRLWPLLSNTRSLKVRMGMLWGPGFHQAAHPDRQPSFATLLDHAIFRGILPRAPELREIWIDGLEVDILQGLRNTGGRDATSNCLYLAGKLVEYYDKLTYVRVDDMAWRVYRDPCEEYLAYDFMSLAGPDPDILAIPAGDVDRELPLAFDSSMPGFYM